MKILKKILYTLLGLIALILIVSLFLPGKLKVISEADVNLPVSKVFYSLASFNNHSKWDPWIVKDTTSVITVMPVQGYLGSKYSWTGKDSGAGEMVIDSVVKNKYISLSLSFVGIKQKAKVWYELTPLENNRTRVSWGFLQDATYPVGRIFIAFFKPSLQKEYNKGINNLKRMLEIDGVSMSTLSEITVGDIQQFDAMIVSGRGIVEETSIKLAKMYSRIFSAIRDQGLEVSGNPFIHNLNYDKETGVSDFEVGVPVKKAGKPSGDVKPQIYKSFKAVKAVHTGPYDEFMNSYNSMLKYISRENISIKGEGWEFYLTDTQMEADELKWQTLIAFPLK